MLSLLISEIHNRLRKSLSLIPVLNDFCTFHIIITQFRKIHYLLIYASVSKMASVLTRFLPKLLTQFSSPYENYLLVSFHPLWFSY